MTIIIALKDEKNKKIYLGADKQGTVNKDIAINVDCKLLKMEIPMENGDISDMYIAFSGILSLHTYLWKVYQAPIYDDERDFVEYLYNDFFYGLRNELIEKKSIVEESGIVDSETGLIIVYGEDIYIVHDDFGIELKKKYGVNGSGYIYATSVIENNLEFHSDIDYRKIVEEALYTTGKLNIYCNTDYDILTIDY